MITLRNLAAIAAVAAAGTAFAQTDTIIAPEDIFVEQIINETKVIYMGGNEEVDSSAYRSHLNQFYQDQFRHAQDPRAPYFMMLSRNGKIGMGIGGNLRLSGNFDFDGSQNGLAFVPYNIPMTVDPTNKDRLQVTPNRTAIYFSVFGNDARFGVFQLYIQARFNGMHDAFCLDRAYATVGDFTLGYTKSTFDDPTAQPSTVEIEGPNSEIDDTRVLFRYMHRIKDNFSFAASVENPSYKVPANSDYTSISATVPDFAAFLQYAFGHNHVRLSGIMRTLGYRDLVAGANHHVAGWGLNLTAKVRPVNPLTIYAAANYGEGINSLVNDLQYGSSDLLGYADKPGKMYAPRSFGYYGALQYHYSPTVFSTIIFSHERILPKSNSVYGGSEYKYGIYGTANVFWNIAPRFQVGGEFSIGRRMNIDGAHRNGYRASLMAEFSF